jgi:hypothetical protein
LIFRIMHRSARRKEYFEPEPDDIAASAGVGDVMSKAIAVGRANQALPEKSARAKPI